VADLLLYFIGVVMPYIAVGVFFGGLLYRVIVWLRVPVPVRIPVTPAPITRIGVVSRMATEFFTFRSLLKSNKKLWLGGYVFHVMLGITFLVHLFNLILYQSTPSVVGATWFDYLSTFSGLIFGFALAFLIIRRLVVSHIRYLSKLADYTILILLFAIVFLGNYTRSFSGVNVELVRKYLLSLIAFKPILPPANIYFLAHYVLGQILLIYIPFSKVSHIIGWLFAPTRNMRNIARYKRHINPWNDEVSGKIMTWEEYYEKFKDELEALGPGGERK